MTLKVKPRATEDYFQDLKSHGVDLIGFQNFLGLVIPFFLLEWEGL